MASNYTGWLLETLDENSGIDYMVFRMLCCSKEALANKSERDNDRKGKSTYKRSSKKRS